MGSSDSLFLTSQHQTMEILPQPQHPLWYQRPEEPNQWFSRFSQFRLLGARRTIESVFQAERAAKGSKGQQRPSRHWYNAAKDWQWIERAIAWDEHQRALDETVWNRRRSEIREREWQLSEKLLNKAEKLLDENSSLSRQSIPAMVQTASVIGRKASELWQDDLDAAITILRRFGFAIIPPEQEFTEEDNFEEAD
jgi:hypothetical protein